ncbi:hypothetical protein [Desulfatitalea alkaliphila]|uniref:Protochlamydia outer membrane protein domain-containing protein n=1 Tax=Desulfatitalea alkaliphila TaxID=2929485 RepID=A0AA41UJA9_9BACT|nr:hypothetical protein [Desulfatitalea alkaliphila]MCJ8500954.1 hypothetical protein [Desulfatitalea alkaliphila]
MGSIWLRRLIVCGWLAVAVWAGMVINGTAADVFAEAGDDGTAQTSVEVLSGATRTNVQNVLGHLQGSIGLAAGLRFDSLDWSISGAYGGEPVNVRSELEWTEVFSYQLQLSGRLRAGRHLYCRGHFAYAAIQSGMVTDSDYRGPIRTNVYSRSISATNDDQLWDVVAGLGYPFHFVQERLLVAPLLGFSVHKQNFRITNGRQLIAGGGSNFDGLNSTYKALWWGPWVGCDLHYTLMATGDRPPPMEWTLMLMYHFRTDFSAEATWNLRDEFRQPRSFEQSADGHGFTVQAEWLLHLTRYLRGSLQMRFTRWSTDAGTDTLFLKDGTTHTTRLNEVSRQAYEVMIGLAYRF